MWKEYKKIYNSKDKGKEELTRLKDEFLRENKENIFKCVETNRMGDIFHLLDNHYDYVRDSVYKSKNEQKDLEEAEAAATEANKKAEETQAKLAEAEAAEAKAKAEGNAAALAEAKKSAEDAKQLASEAKSEADLARKTATETTSKLGDLTEYKFEVPADGEKIKADLLIGANGMHSTVRAFLNLEIELEFSGKMLRDSKRRVTEFCGTNCP